MIDADQKNGEEYQDTTLSSHRMPMYDSHIGRLKNRAPNFMYHSVERVSAGGNTSSSSESIASDPPPYLPTGVPVKQKRDSIRVNAQFNYPARTNPVMSL